MSKIITVDYSIMRYFAMMNDFDNNSEVYRTVTAHEFKEELGKALGGKVRWKNKPKK